MYVIAVAPPMLVAAGIVVVALADGTNVFKGAMKIENIGEVSLCTPPWRSCMLYVPSATGGIVYTKDEPLEGLLDRFSANARAREQNANSLNTDWE
jgi:hypothetical protein